MYNNKWSYRDEIRSITDLNGNNNINYSAEYFDNSIEGAIKKYTVKRNIKKQNKNE